MAILSPVGDLVLAGLGILGSPAIGYIVVRTAIASSSEWKGWKRLLVSLAVGIGWVSLLLGVVSPIGQTTVSVLQLAEIGFIAGMGGILLVGLVAAATRLSHCLLHFKTSVGVVHTAPKVSPQETAKAVPKKKTTKPVLAAPEKQEAGAERLEAPVIENDILDLLKEETSDRLEKKKMQQKPPVERIEEDLSKTAEELGFEDTIAQLKRDLKEFNESVGKEHKRKESM
jgi:hypothetical protein